MQKLGWFSSKPLFPLLATILLFSCKPFVTSTNALSASGASSPVYMSTGDFLVPQNGSWTGRLIFPEQRKPDGGVWFEVYSAPKGITPPGKTLWLSMDTQSPAPQEYVRRTTTSINFGASGGRAAASMAAKNILPERLNGLANVSPLESLAGARPLHYQDRIGSQMTADSVEVLLRSASLRNGVLYTSTEPVQIVGKEVALISFVEPVGEDQYKVKHYVRGSGFSGAEEIVSLLPTSERRPHHSTKNIHMSKLNQMGWFAYGEHVNNLFLIRALEPRELMRALPAGVPNGEDYIRKQNFENVSAEQGKISTATVSATRNYDIRLGETGLVMHLFGGLAGKDGDSTMLLPISKRRFNPGHFSFGTGKVITEPFTGEPKFDIEYKQVYAHNSDGIVSGSNLWHSYSGSLKRGWMYSRPISDVFVKHSAFTSDYTNANFSPLAALSHELEVMMGRFRSGDGTGVSEVTAATSCAQDSNQAMFIALKKGLDGLLSESTQSRLSDDEKKRAATLEKVMESYLSQVVRGANFRSDWKEALSEPLAIKKDALSPLATFLSVIESRKVLIPRWVYDDAAVLFLNAGATLQFLRTNQIGGQDPDIIPRAPGFD
jgi:predicted Abi (CAAX) family protease